MMKRKHALIIGGTKGIGHTLAHFFAREGCIVSVIGRSLPQSRQRTSRMVHYWSCDLSDCQKLFQTLDEIVQKRGKLNYAAFLQRFRGKGDEWSGEIETSLTATKKTIEYLVNNFDAREASIVLVSSACANLIAHDVPVSYHVAKTALVQMARYYAVELGQKSIRVNCVSPGTTLKEETKNHYLSDKRLLHFYQKLIPLGRMGTAREVAQAIGFLCSPSASFITGQNLVVDGGVSIQWQETLAARLRYAHRTRKV